MKILQTQKHSALLLAFLFVFSLICNLLTPMMADDFAYSFSFATGERITSIFDIFPSMEAHIQKMNGRTAAHFLAQLFLLLPWWLFDIINAAVFTGVFCLMGRVISPGKRVSGGMYLFLFGLLFLALPDFGQVALWLDGSCNYLWGIPCVLGYLYPFVQNFCSGKTPKHPVACIGLLLLSFLAGGYLENLSGAAILISVLLLALSKWKYRQSIGVALPASLVLACMGLLTLALSPAQFENKGGTGTTAMLTTFLISLGVIALLSLPITIYILLWRRAKREGGDPRAILLSYVFLIGAAASNFVMILAAYYPLRCAIGTTVFLLLAIGVLACRMDWTLTKKQRSVRRVLAFGLAALFLAMGIGLCDIARTHVDIKQNEAIILAADASDTVRLPILSSYTKYSGLFNLKYLGYTADDWPNDSMAKYFGVHGIIGEE